MFCTMLVIVLHAKHLPMNSGNYKRLVRLQAWLKIIPPYSITSCFHTDASSRVKVLKVIQFYAQIQSLHAHTNSRNHLVSASAHLHQSPALLIQHGFIHYLPPQSIQNHSAQTPLSNDLHCPMDTSSYALHSEFLQARR